MDRPALLGIVVVLLILLVALMYVGWRGRARRQAALPPPHPVPAELGRIHREDEVFYVATTVAGDPLDRVAVSGLGFRARASLTVAESGIVLGIPGEHDVFIPRHDILGVDRATWTIDRVVETDGLVVLRWVLRDGTDRAGTPTVEVDSYFRVNGAASAEPLISDIHRLLEPSSTRGDAA